MRKQLRLSGSGGQGVITAAIITPVAKTVIFLLMFIITSTAHFHLSHKNFIKLSKYITHILFISRHQASPRF